MLLTFQQKPKLSSIKSKKMLQIENLNIGLNFSFILFLYSLEINGHSTSFLRIKLKYNFFLICSILIFFKENPKAY